MVIAAYLRELLKKAMGHPGWSPVRTVKASVKLLVSCFSFLHFTHILKISRHAEAGSRTNLGARSSPYHLFLFCPLWPTPHLPGRSGPWQTLGPKIAVLMRKRALDGTVRLRVFTRGESLDLVSEWNPKDSHWGGAE